MSWNIGDNRNLFLKLKSKLGLYNVVFTTRFTSLEKLTLTLIKIQQLPNIEKIDSDEKIACLKGTENKSRSSKTDIEKLNILVYRYGNIFTRKIAMLFWN